MATFSLGTSGAPGVYVNERAGTVASAGVATFSTVYMLVEAPETAPVTTFPFNTPTPVTTLADYKALIGGSVPADRIPLLSYNCVDEFFQNAQVGDLRVVRVGTPNQIVELELLPSGTKAGTSGLPSALRAGDTVYLQITINGLPLVAGDGSTGYTANGDWLGVPVVIPVNYVAGDVSNNRRISKVMADAVAAAIESNPSVRSAAYIRDFGLVNDVLGDGSENGYVTIAGATFDSTVSVTTTFAPQGTTFALTQSGYNIDNIVGEQSNLTRVPQDYIQCIATAFDGQQDQGYLITPTAYAQFNAEGRAAVGAAAATHCESNDYKWMALADPGPYLVTDINEYSDLSPYQPAETLTQGDNYLVSNKVYEWVGDSVSTSSAEYLQEVGNASPEIAVSASVNTLSSGSKIGLLDPGTFTLTSATPNAELGKFVLSGANWPSDIQIQEVILSDVTTGSDFEPLGTTAYVVAPPYNTLNKQGDYCSDGVQQIVFLAADPVAASQVLDAVIYSNGSEFITVAAPAGAFAVAAPTGSTCNVSYSTPAWDLTVNINGQDSNLIENITTESQTFNTLHLPGTLQDPTESVRLGAISRTFLNFNAAISSVTLNGVSNVASINCVSHGLTDGQKVFLTQNVYLNTVITGTVFLAQSNSYNLRPYYVRVIDNDSFALASDIASLSNNFFIQFPSDPIVASPGVIYTEIEGGSLSAASLSPLKTLTMIRGRKYGIAAGSISNESCLNDLTPSPGQAGAFGYRIHLSESESILSPSNISTWGETTGADYLPSLITSSAGSTTTAVENFFCAPTVEQSFSTTSFLVPSSVPQEIGSWDGTAETGFIDPALTPYGASWETAGLAGAQSGGGGPQPASYWEGPAGAALVGNYLLVAAGGGLGPNGETVNAGDTVTAVFNGKGYDLVVTPQDTLAGRDIDPYATPFWGSQTTFSLVTAQAPPASLWRFDAITADEIFSDALRGVGSGGTPQATLIEGGVDNVNALLEDSQRYTNPFGFIAYYGSYIQNSAGQYIPPSPYVTGVALRRYRAEGYQFPPAGVKFQLADAIGVQIPINSAQQNLLNPAGCNAIRTLPGYPDSAVFIWGGRTRVNASDSQQKLYQFVNTRVIMNVVYGSLRSAFDTQIFNVIDGFGVVYNQIISVGNSILNQLYVAGALYGARPSDAFQVICDDRINPPSSLENGIVNAKVFVTPVPTLERIQIDLIRVAIGNMQKELDVQGLGVDNTL